MTGSASVNVELAIYPIDIVLRAAHAFTARCFVTPRITGEGLLTVDFTPRDANDSLDDVPGEFENALLDARLRATIAAETQMIRELIVAQAFCEADLLDRRDSESDEYTDPRGIAR